VVNKSDFRETKSDMLVSHVLQAPRQKSTGRPRVAATLLAGLALIVLVLSTWDIESQSDGAALALLSRRNVCNMFDCWTVTSSKTDLHTLQSRTKGAAAPRALPQGLSWKPTTRLRKDDAAVKVNAITSSFLHGHAKFVVLFWLLSRSCTN
jgi:hypothetical protein